MDISCLAKTAVPQSMKEEKIKKALPCLNSEEKHYRKHEYVFTAGHSVSKMGIVLSGSIIIESNDYWGKPSIIQPIGKGQYIATAYAYALAMAKPMP